ncbi:MAG: hypothetical protein JWN27_756 [Candidatus Eremiobacteraeota bacterium]|nr:hypothetical protein [Candidatus Eremiobacteraeota bacterium]
MNLRQLALVGLAALAVGGTAAAQVAQPVQVAQATPPPPPSPGRAATPSGSAAPAPALTLAPAPSASPSAAPAPAGRRGRKAGSPEPNASPSDTPEPPQFQTMDGVWEVVVQPMAVFRPIYSHFYITQKGDQITGTWVRDNNQKVPITGTFDGRLFTLTGTDGKTTWTMKGYAENFGDMVGLLTTADPKDKGTPFTAAHRKKEKLG